MIQICFLNIHVILPLNLGHLSIQDILPRPQGVHNKGVPRTVYRTLHQVPKVTTIEGFHCIQDILPGPQGVHNKGVPRTVYRTLHQVPKVTTIEGFHCIQDILPGPQGAHNRGVPLYTENFTRSPRCPQ